MSILKNHDETELIVDCMCGCYNGIHFRIDKEDPDYYCIMTFTSGNFYRDQCDSFRRVFIKKLKKIWAIIRNKDYYYSDIALSMKDYETFKEYINRF